MKACSKCGEFKPLALFRANSRAADGRRADCASCESAQSQRRYQRNRGRRLERQRQYSLENQLRIEEYRQSYQLRMRGHLCERAAMRKGRPWVPMPRTEEERLRHEAEMRLRLEARRRFQASARRKGVRRATPPWADRRAIFELFVAARHISAVAGALWHVDHIVPLNSPIVCGLHWHGNLQLLPAAVNIAKSNRTWPDAP